MSDQEQDPRLPDPAEDTPKQADASQPADLRSQIDLSEAEAGEPDVAAEPPATPAAPAAGARGKGPDYVSEIRQELSSEGTRRKKTGGLFRRLTGPLRRRTAPLESEATPTAPEDLPQPPQPPEPLDVSDDFFTGRLGGAAASTPAPLSPDEIELPPSWREEEPGSGEGLPQTPLFADDSGLSGNTAGPLDFDPFADEPQPEVNAGSGFDEGALGSTPLFDESEDFLAFGEQPGGVGSEEGEPDWMSEIRHVDQDQPAAPQPSEEKPAGEKPPVRSGPLSFLTGILHGEGRRQGEESLPDDLVTGRLERSLGLGAKEPPAQEEEPGGSVPLFAEGEAPEAAIFEDMESGVFAPPAGGETPPLEISEEDERLLWGEAPPLASSAADGPTLRPEDVWGEGSAAGVETPAPPETPPPSRRTPAEAPNVDDLMAASFLTGSDMPDLPPPGYSQDQILRDVLEQTSAPEETVSIEEIRNIALEGYEEGEELPPALQAYRPYAPADTVDQQVLAQEAAAAAVQAKVLEEWEGQEGGPRFSLRPAGFAQWFHRRTRVEKILLIEAAVVAVVLLIAVPFFIYMVNRGPVYQSGYLIPRPLPADMPYPTRVELPGGWSFPLEKSTFVAGRWKPENAEWLEGTELRRVVALPWNTQTEAVVSTFKKGDQVLLKMSNGDTLDYTVTSVDRISAKDSEILSDTRPSLVLVLYKEKSDERWVVFCKP